MNRFIFIVIIEKLFMIYLFHNDCLIFSFIDFDA